MAHQLTSAVRARRLRERRARGMVEVGEGGVALLVGNGLLKMRQAGGACFMGSNRPTYGRGA